MRSGYRNAISHCGEMWSAVEITARYSENHGGHTVLYAPLWAPLRLYAGICRQILP